MVVYYVDVNFLMVLVVMINDHAIKHYRTTGYPLAVKLGTITKKGNGDVYSYDENDMVDDPNLIIHLSH